MCLSCTLQLGHHVHVPALSRVARCAVCWLRVVASGAPWQRELPTCCAGVCPLQAARVLEFPGHGLAYLLDHYCGFKVCA